MTAMRNLSLIEIRKVSQYISAQSKLLKTIEDVRDDFFSFYPPPETSTPESPKLYILLGSQRGFCGSFNEGILSQFKDDNAGLIIVGEKLRNQLADHPHIVAAIDGPNVAEDIQAVILSLTHVLATHPIGDWCIIYNERVDTLCTPQTLRPLSKLYEVDQRLSSSEPLLYLSKDEFITQFIDQYLFALLNQIFYQSFSAENNSRFNHLSGAISRLEKKCEHLKSRLNVLRQEEITEEIETILLGFQPE